MDHRGMEDCQQQGRIHYADSVAKHFLNRSKQNKTVVYFRGTVKFHHLLNPANSTLTFTFRPKWHSSVQISIDINSAFMRAFQQL
jgi:hypothetical protein